MQYGDPWTEDQARLINEIVKVWLTDNVWPSYGFLADTLLDANLVAIEVLNSFPNLGIRTPTTFSYSDVIYDHNFPEPPEDSKVAITVGAANRHALGQQFAQGFIAVLRVAAARRRYAKPDPTKPVDVTLTSQEVAAELAPIWLPEQLRPVGMLLEKDWPHGMRGVFPQPDGSWQVQLSRDITQYLGITTVEEYLDAIRRQVDASAATQSAWYGTSSIQESDVAEANDIFIVHGHDGEAKHHVARIVQQLTDHVPIILDEKASRGLTVIEKFEEHGGNAAFAIVLLTPDDVGGQKNGETRPRARQNVIFELGYFIGHLGRGRVVAMTKGDVEIPSDFSGIVYISLDQDDWPQRLAKEMREVDALDVDMNRL
ncbi:MAG: nucleotide-binding protein [Actinomycetota bacterium]|nr:nucleotide-binding protein [Actinomycetota bacterium]MDQ2848075.1 nucleotide-binding protein [Actinomycetota bacterium]